jgi:hypothetical protein
MRYISVVMNLGFPGWNVTLGIAILEVTCASERDGDSTTMLSLSLSVVKGFFFFVFFFFFCKGQRVRYPSPLRKPTEPARDGMRFSCPLPAPWSRVLLFFPRMAKSGLTILETNLCRLARNEVSIIHHCALSVPTVFFPFPFPRMSMLGIFKSYKKNTCRRGIDLCSTHALSVGGERSRFVFLSRIVISMMSGIIGMACHAIPRIDGAEPEPEPGRDRICSVHCCFSRW